MIIFENVWYRYETEFVLSGISLTIPKGSVTVVIGPNGCGKTTLLKHINGLLLPTKGTIFVDGLSTKKNGDNIRKKVGIVFQNPEDQMVYPTVEEDIGFGLENLRRPPVEIKRRVGKILTQLCLARLASRDINSLSFGQKQLVALAGALVMEPDHILLDEPTTFLDAAHKKNILHILKGLKKQGTTIIMATHRPEDISFADRIVVLHGGKIFWEGASSKMKKSMLFGAGLYDA